MAAKNVYICPECGRKIHIDKGRRAPENCPSCGVELRQV